MIRSASPHDKGARTAPSWIQWNGARLGVIASHPFEMPRPCAPRALLARPATIDARPRHQIAGRRSSNREGPRARRVADVAEISLARPLAFGLRGRDSGGQWQGDSPQAPEARRRRPDLRYGRTDVRCPGRAEARA